MSEQDTDQPDGSLELARAVARIFADPDGQRLQRHLERSFLLRRLSPQASDAELRFVEGQRCLVAHLQALATRGQSR